MNFLDVKTDFAFKKVFGSEESKDILISFLNAVDLFDGKQKIVSFGLCSEKPGCRVATCISNSQ